MKLRKFPEYDLSVLQSFFEPFNFTIAVEAILEQSSDGSLWMDNLAHPTLAVLWNSVDGVYIMSEEKIKEHPNVLKTLFREEIIPEAENRYETPVFVIYVLPEYSENEIRALFDSKWDISKQKASFYEFPLVELPSKQRVQKLPPSFEGNLMDRNLLRDSSIQNIGVLRGEIESDWGSIENFLVHSFGYYIKNRDEKLLTAWVLVEKIARSCAEFAIETVEQYQRQGLAQFAAQEAIKHALERGLVPHWYCFQNNIPSVNLAEKIGFQKKRDFEVYVIVRQ